MQETGVVLRPARPDDARPVWEWRNDPAARAASFAQDPIEFPSHEQWFRARLDDPATVFLVAEDAGGTAIGYVRFAFAAPGTGAATTSGTAALSAEISVGLAPASRGRGLGRAVIRNGCTALAAAHGPVRVTARVKAGNEASLRAFAAAGFAGGRPVQVAGGEAVELVLAP
jgi:UDP-2,4-diacetamido-2,4,6-trideoxy-beta-L-altropyranose hydrolase